MNGVKKLVCLAIFITVGATVPLNDIAANPTLDQQQETAMLTQPDRKVFGGIEFSGGAASFADVAIRYEPDLGGGPIPAPANRSAVNILGVPETGVVSLGNGGRITVMFLDNQLTGSNDSNPDLRIFEVGSPETTYVEISTDAENWHAVGTATGYASGIDIDQYGFSRDDRFRYVRITDDGDSPTGSPFVQGADIAAVGAQSSIPAHTSRMIVYQIQAHVGGRSRLIISRNTMQWHHLEGTAPGRGNGFNSFDTIANSPTIIDSNHGPNIGWIPESWPEVIGDGTHPESLSSVFDSLTPVMPTDGVCWHAKKVYGDGQVKIVQQPSADNDYHLVVEFDDLRPVYWRWFRHQVERWYFVAGTGFYVVRLSYTGKAC